MLLLLFFLSGFSALIYQIVWLRFRAEGVQTTATVHQAAGRPGGISMIDARARRSRGGGGQGCPAARAAAIRSAVTKRGSMSTGTSASLSSTCCTSWRIVPSRSIMSFAFA